MKRIWLIEARQALGLTQGQTARKAGLSPNHYCNIENGNRGARIPSDKAHRIAQVLGIDWTLFYS